MAHESVLRVVRGRAERGAILAALMTLLLHSEQRSTGSVLLKLLPSIVLGLLLSLQLILILLHVEVLSLADPHLLKLLLLTR